MTWNGTPIVSVPPSLEWIVPETSIFEQFVGLNWKSPRVVAALICWISRGIPSIEVGIESGVPGGFDVIVSAAVSGLTSILPRTRMQSQAGLKLFVCARSNGPAFAGTVERHPERRAAGFDHVAAARAVVGAGEVELAARDRVRVATHADGDGRFPDLAVGAALAQVGLRFRAQFDARRIPESPGGRFASTDCRFCSPSERFIVSVNG